jgi:hypothetical protein
MKASWTFQSELFARAPRRFGAIQLWDTTQSLGGAGAQYE